jgi:large subunit ribosomal protein L1
VHASIGRVSFDSAKLVENTQELINTLIRMKPATAKGMYLKGVSMATSMSPGVAVDTKTVA